MHSSYLVSAQSILCVSPDMSAITSIQNLYFTLLYASQRYTLPTPAHSLLGSNSRPLPRCLAILCRLPLAIGVPLPILPTLLPPYVSLMKGR